jgi:hypothetical protein
VEREWGGDEQEDIEEERREKEGEVAAQNLADSIS